MSLYDTRAGLLVPKTGNSLAIGSELLPLKELVSTEGHFKGTVRAHALELDGFNFQKQTLLPFDTSNNQVVGRVNTSNLEVKNDITCGGEISGGGGGLDLTAIRSSIKPGAPDLTLGPFTAGQIHDLTTNQLEVANTCKANFFEGDGRGLTNVTPRLLDINTPILNDGASDSYDIGTRSKPFGNVFCKALEAGQHLRGQKLIIANVATSEIEPPPGEQQDPITIPRILEEGVFDDEVRSNLGNMIDVQALSAVFGGTYTLDATIKNLRVQNGVSFGRDMSFGSAENPLGEVYANTGHFMYAYSNYGDMYIGSNLLVKGQTTVVDDLHCQGDIYGIGRFIDGIDHLAPQVSNLEPLYPEVVTLGTSERPWLKLHATNAELQDMQVDSVAVASNLSVAGNPVKHDDWIDLKPRAQTWSGFGPFMFHPIQENTSTFASEFVPDQGQFVLTRPGLYAFTTHAIKTQSSSLDNEFVWTVNQTVSSVGRVVTHQGRGLATLMIFVEAGDKIRLGLRSSGRSPISVYEQGGVFITLLTCTEPAMPVKV